MALVVRPAGYTGFLQRLVWAQGDNVPVTAYLWGGGGGGGGADSASGGVGGGAGYAQVNFVVNEGDIIEVAVGGKGTGGESGRGNAAGGEAGASFITDFDFNARTAVTSPAVFPQFNSAYCTFLNNNGVWVNPTSAAVFDRTWTVNFPTTGNYQFTMCADNFARCFVDDVEVFYADNFQTPFTIGYPVTAGTRSIRILGDNTGGPGAVALTIVNSINGASFSGGRGGNSGPAGSSGAGGGGGGATVIILNGTAIAAAAGGGGGGGGGNSGNAAGQSAPGNNGQAAPGDNAGQNGTNKAADGGGGGGGGGGWGGGNGGDCPPGDQGGIAGTYGLTSGTVTADPSGQNPGGTSNQYWRNAGVGGVRNGGNGTTGYAVFEFEVSGLFVHVNGVFNPVTETYVKANGVWNQVRSAYIKQGGAWLPVNGSITPQFENVLDRFGINPRSGVQEKEDGEVTNPGGEAGGFDGGGGGGGGGKVICTALYELGYMEKEIFEYDQAYGLWLYQNDFVSYRGYRAWADVLVQYVKGQGRPMLPKLLFWKTADEQQRLSQKLAISLARVIGGAFSKEIARRAGYDLPFSIGGWLCVTVGLAVNKAIGYVVKKIKTTSTIDYKE
jgi:hypothetical protein